MEPLRLGTKVVHAGENRPRAYHAVTTPIVQCSTYAFEDTVEIQDYLARKEAGVPDRHEYGRYGNPTQRVAERRLAELEGAEEALLFATGMSAISTTLMALLAQGDHVIVATSTYRQTRNLVRDHLSRWGIDATFLGDGDIGRLEESIRPSTRVILCEAPTNPYLRVIDIERVAEIARKHGVLTAVDATFATPVNLRPLDLGIDVVFHSATKYLGGHNDLLAGFACGSREILSRVEMARGVMGGVGGPMDAYLIIRGLKTLELRVERHNQTAARIAEALAQHPAVRVVHYPGLASHPDHDVAKRLFRGFGGVVSFEMEDGAAASRVIDALEIPQIGPTLGGVESMVQQQAIFISLDEAERRKYGIPDALIRYAVGVEDPDDLAADLRRALDQASGQTTRTEAGE